MRLLGAFAAGAVLAVAMAPGGAQASLSLSAIQGGQPTGTVLFNFDDLTVGGSSGQTTFSLSGGHAIEVEFAGSAGIVSGSTAPNTPPFLSGSNGLGFGAGGSDQQLGADDTVYLTSGSDGLVRDSVLTLILPAPVNYFGLLWGSIDDDHSVEFLDGTTLVGSMTGASVTAFPDGNAGASGTRYVNVTSTLAFDRVVFRSQQSALEFDNVALAALPSTAVPEPVSLGMLGVGLAGLGVALRRRRAG